MRKNNLQGFNLLPFGGFNTTTPTALQSIPPSAQKMAVITTSAIFHNLTLPARGKIYIKTFVNSRVQMKITVGSLFHKYFFQLVNLYLEKLPTLWHPLAMLIHFHCCHVHDSFSLKLVSQLPWMWELPHSVLIRLSPTNEWASISRFSSYSWCLNLRSVCHTLTLVGILLEYSHLHLENMFQNVITPQHRTV